MATLINSTPLNVAAAMQASGTPAPVKGAPAVVEARPSQTMPQGHTAGPPGFATPHATPPVIAGVSHAPTTPTLGNNTQQKK